MHFEECPWMKSVIFAISLMRLAKFSANSHAHEGYSMSIDLTYLLKSSYDCFVPGSFLTGAAMQQGTCGLRMVGSKKPTMC